MKNKTFIADFEGDGLEPTKIHVVSVNTGEKIVSTRDYNLVKDLLENPDYTIVGHNFIWFDEPHLARLTGANTKATIIDTLVLSWYLEPKRAKHGLEEWGKFFGYPKVKIDDWHHLSYEEYKERCERDVEINTKLWEYFKKYLLELYGSWKEAQKLINYLMFKARCAVLAEKNRWKLDLELTNKNLAILQEEKEAKEKTLASVMPKIPVYRTMQYPAKPQKKDGTPTATYERWKENCEELRIDPESVEEIQIEVGQEEPNPSSHDQIKRWLFSLGWEPCSYKNNKKGEAVPQINSLDPASKGELSPSVVRLIEKNPELEELQGLFILNHRKSILEGFLRQVDEEGYVKARVAGLTNTLRFKHADIVNLPGISTPYGEYIRPCLTAPYGKELCGSDMASLEDRTKQHYMFNWDPEYVKEMNVPGFDPHLDIAVTSGMMSRKDAEDYRNKIRVEELKPIRHGAKTTNYSCTYGAFPKKIASSTGMSLKEATILWNAYWSRNWSITKIAESCDVKEVNGQKWLFNPVSKLWYSLRHEKDRFSTLNQGTGAYCFDVWLGLVLKEVDTLVGQFHDELILVIDKKEGERDRIEKILRNAIKQANQFLKLNRELDIGVDFGDNYGEIH